MWGGVYGWIKYVVSLGAETQRNRADIEQMRAQIKDLGEQVNGILWREQQREREDALREENLLLKIRLQLLDFERRLPPPPPGTPPSPSLDKD